MYLVCFVATARASLVAGRHLVLFAVVNVASNVNTCILRRLVQADFGGCWGRSSAISRRSMAFQNCDINVNADEQAHQTPAHTYPARLEGRGGEVLNLDRISRHNEPEMSVCPPRNLDKPLRVVSDHLTNCGRGGSVNGTDGWRGRGEDNSRRSGADDSSSQRHAFCWETTSTP